VAGRSSTVAIGCMFVRLSGMSRTNLQRPRSDVAGSRPQGASGRGITACGRDGVVRAEGSRHPQGCCTLAVWATHPTTGCGEYRRASRKWERWHWACREVNTGIFVCLVKTYTSGIHPPETRKPDHEANLSDMEP
jgi:hypothetical protein